MRVPFLASVEAVRVATCARVRVPAPLSSVLARARDPRLEARDTLDGTPTPRFGCDSVACVVGDRETWFIRDSGWVRIRGVPNLGDYQKGIPTMKKRFSLIALLAVFALIVAACSSDTEETTTTTVAEDSTTVVDLAIEAGQFSTLVAAVEAAGLVETLQGEGPFTVLAPTDAAFEAAFEALGITAEELLADTETLTQILLYHVLGQAADSQLVASLDGQEVATVQGEAISISVDGGTIFINETAEVVSADLTADNGIVHVINQVILPPTIAEALGVAAPEETTTTTEAPTTTTTTEAPAEPTIAEIVVELASGDPAEFTVLLAAVQAADPAVLEALSDPNQELTVFAPTDEAFGNLLEALGISAEDLLANPELTNVLLYHVAPGVFLAEDVVAAAPIPELPTLLEGETLSIEVVDGSVVINGESTVIQTDVVASNGVIHVIDTVLVYESFGQG